MVNQHNHPFFYKYMTAEAAIKVIETQSFRWSSPRLFNDPFDHQTGFSLSFSGKELAQALGKEMERISYNEMVYEPKVMDGLSIPLKIFALSKNKPERAIYHQQLETAMAQIEYSFEKEVEKLNSMLIDHICHSRVFCVSETNSNIAMWAYYSDNHNGAVFQLNCLEEIDNPLLIAREVNYTDKILPFCSLEEYVRHLTNQAPLNYRNLVDQSIYTKHIHWAHEKEWRVTRPLLDESEGDGFMYLKEKPQVFGAIYLGCRIIDMNKELIQQALRIHLPDMPVYQAEISLNPFSLH